MIRETALYNINRLLLSTVTDHRIRFTNYEFLIIR